MKIKELIKKYGINTILIAGLIVLGILYLNQCSKSSKLKDDATIAEMNARAQSDSIRTYKTKNGTLVYEKSALIASKNELKDLNSALYKEIKDLNNNPKIVIKEKIKIVHDTVKVNTIITDLGNNKFQLSWKNDTTYSANNYHKLHGRTQVVLDSTGLKDPITYIDVNEIGMSFTTGLNKGKDNYEIFIKSDYPGFTATSIEGAIIDKKMITSNESSFVIGPSIGYGLVFTNGVINYGPTVGITITYNLNKTIKKIFRPFGL
jgi:archaellum component FlaF (FlaF/FlaG flagellin family)